VLAILTWRRMGLRLDTWRRLAVLAIPGARVALVFRPRDLARLCGAALGPAAAACLVQWTRHGLNRVRQAGHPVGFVPWALAVPIGVTATVLTFIGLLLVSIGVRSMGIPLPV
jgi:hypothetical protein